MSFDLSGAIKRFTSDINQPAFKSLVFAILTLATGGVYWVCMVFEKEIQEAAWGLWLGFLAAGWGITFLDYRTKRQTTYSPQVPAGNGATVPGPVKSADTEPPPPFEQGG